METGTAVSGVGRRVAVTTTGFNIMVSGCWALNAKGVRRDDVRKENVRKGREVILGSGQEGRRNGVIWGRSSNDETATGQPNTDSACSRLRTLAGAPVA